MDLTFPMRKPFEKTRFLTYEEEAAILSELDQHRGSPAYDKARDLFVFLIDTGVKFSEALNMAWPEIDLTRGTMEVYRSKGHNLSMVPISDRVREVLVRNQDQSAPFEGMDRALKHLRRLVSKHYNGNPKVNAQRGKATFHSLRDTYASRLATKGMSLHKVSKLLGHTTGRCCTTAWPVLT
jgi:integrase